MTFDMKVRFDTGRKFAISVGSRPDLLSRGVTIVTSTDYDYNIASTAKSRMPKVHVRCVSFATFFWLVLQQLQYLSAQSVQISNAFLNASLSEVVVLLVSSDLGCLAYCSVITAVD